MEVYGITHNFVIEDNPLKTKSISAILIDDEVFALTNLSSLLERYCPSIDVLDKTTDAVIAIEKVNTKKPDVIFLDVNMKGINGFELLQKLTYMPFVVFVTAHQQHALKALKVCAVDFLLKPIDIKELIETEKKLLQVMQFTQEIKESYAKVIVNFRSMIENPSTTRKLTLASRNGYEIINMDDILYVSGEDNYSSFYSLNHKPRLVTKTLKEYEEILLPYGFMRIHKSTIINLSHMVKFNRGEREEVLMIDGSLLTVSRRKSVELTEWIKQSTLEKE